MVSIIYKNIIHDDVDDGDSHDDDIKDVDNFSNIIHDDVDDGDSHDDDIKDVDNFLITIRFVWVTQ